MNLEHDYIVNSDFVLRKIGQVFFIVDIVKNRLFELNKTLVEIFLLLSQSYEFEQIVDTISEKYGIEKAIVQQDVEKIISRLIEIGAINSPKDEMGEQAFFLVPKRPLSYYVKNYWSTQEHPYKVKSFELTPQCNFWCYHCYQGNLKLSNFLLDTETIKRIIDKMVDIGVLQVIFSGGEPLIRPDFFEIYRYAKQKGLMVRVFTNGSLITQDHISLFKELPPERLIISVYGACENTYQKTTNRKGVYDKVMSNINSAIREGIPLSLKLIVSKLTVQDFPTICEFAIKNHVELRYAFYIFPTNTNDKSVCDNMLDVKDMLKIDILYQKEFNKNITGKKNDWKLFYQKNGFVPKYLCDFPHNQFYIDYEGKVFACSAGLKRLGGDFLSDDFDIIWQRFKSIRNEPMSIINECVSCEALYYCVNCPADEYSFYGDAELINKKICLFAKAKYLYYNRNLSFEEIVKKLEL